jgi:hypothetical protein
LKTLEEATPTNGETFSDRKLGKKKDKSPLQAAETLQRMITNAISVLENIPLKG